jgi:hypothetical protein
MPSCSDRNRVRRTSRRSSAPPLRSPSRGHGETATRQLSEGQKILLRQAYSARLRRATKAASFEGQACFCPTVGGRSVGRICTAGACPPPRLAAATHRLARETATARPQRRDLLAPGPRARSPVFRELRRLALHPEGLEGPKRLRPASHASQRITGATTSSPRLICFGRSRVRVPETPAPETITGPLATLAYRDGAPDGSEPWKLVHLP